MNILIESDLIYLRDIEESDLEDMYELDSDPLVHKYLGNNPVNNKEGSMKIIRDIRNQYRRNGIGRSAIIDKATGEFLGWAGLKYEEQVRSEFSYYDVGYRLKQKHWGRGIGSEAAKLSLVYGFDKLGLSKIGGAADVNNLISNRILSKIGLKPSGSFVLEGTTCNWYELSKEEWMGRN